MTENVSPVNQQIEPSKPEVESKNDVVFQPDSVDVKEEVKKENPWLTPYKKELYKIVFEKLLIALILVIAGFFVTRLVEEYKSKQSFHAELNKTRIQKIGELWEKVYLFASIDERLSDSRVIYYLIGIGETADKIKEIDEKRKEKLRNDRQKLLDEIEELLPKYRFWLGEDNYRAVTEFIYLSQQYNVVSALVMEIYRTKPNIKELSYTESEKQLLEDVSRLRIEVAEARKNILAIRDQMLEE